MLWSVMTCWKSSVNDCCINNLRTHTQSEAGLLYCCLASIICVRDAFHELASTSDITGAPLWILTPQWIVGRLWEASRLHLNPDLLCNAAALICDCRLWLEPPAGFVWNSIWRCGCMQMRCVREAADRSQLGASPSITHTSSVTGRSIWRADTDVL